MEQILESTIIEVNSIIASHLWGRKKLIASMFTDEHHQLCCVIKLIVKDELKGEFDDIIEAIKAYNNA